MRNFPFTLDSMISLAAGLARARPVGRALKRRVQGMHDTAPSTVLASSEQLGTGMTRSN